MGYPIHSLDRTWGSIMRGTLVAKVILPSLDPESSDKIDIELTPNTEVTGGLSWAFSKSRRRHNGSVATAEHDFEKAHDRTSGAVTS